MITKSRSFVSASSLARVLILGTRPNQNVAVDGGWLGGSFDVTNA